MARRWRAHGAAPTTSAYDLSFRALRCSHLYCAGQTLDVCAYNVLAVRTLGRLHLTQPCGSPACSTSAATCRTGAGRCNGNRHWSRLTKAARHRVSPDFRPRQATLGEDRAAATGASIHPGPGRMVGRGGARILCVPRSPDQHEGDGTIPNPDHPTLAPGVTTPRAAGSDQLAEDEPSRPTPGSRLRDRGIPGPDDRFDVRTRGKSPVR